MNLYILAFDHRGSFMKKIVKAQDPPSEEDIAKARELKKIIYKGFERAVEQGVPKDSAGVLVDEWLGKDILADANNKGYITCTPFEQTGKKEFEFDGDYRERLARLNPKYVKVLVRYNPEDDMELNQRQAKRLAELSRFLEDKPQQFLFELLVLPTEEQKSDNYDQELRPVLMIRAINELYEAGIKPDIWKIEGLDELDKMKKVAEVVKAGNENAKIVILGRGESKEKAEHWLRVGKQVDNAVGFAVGRTIFMQPLIDYSQELIKRDEAVRQIAENYRFFVNTWI